MSEQRAEPLRLGSTAPNFQAETTQGKIDFHGSWEILACGKSLELMCE